MNEIEKFNEDMDIISALGDNPGTDDNLPASGLKAKFDLAGNKIKRFLNETLIPFVNAMLSYFEPKTKAYVVTLHASDWVEYRQTVSTPGTTADNPVIIASDPSTHDVFHANGIRAAVQEINSMIFICDSLPETDVLVNILVLSPGVTE